MSPRLVLGAAVAVCAVSAVLALVLLTGSSVSPTGSRSSTGVGTPAPAPSGAPGPGGSAALTAFPPTERVTVIRVVDAVTFDARLPGGREVVRVRALGVQPPGDCYGDAATAFARRVLDGQALDLVPDRPGPAGPPTDPFDRRLAHAVLDQGDYAVLAAEAGIARAYASGASEPSMVAVRDAQDRARGAGRGLWGPPCRGSASVPTPGSS